MHQMRILIEGSPRNPEKYMNLAENKEIKITGNGCNILRLTGIETPKMKAAKALKGILAGKDVDLDKLKMERILKNGTLNIVDYFWPPL